MSKNTLPLYARKPPSKLTNKDVIQFIDDYREWLLSAPNNITFSSFCKEKGITRPYALKDYMMRNFTGLNNTVDFQQLWQEVEKIREDKLIELGIFNKDVNANFITSLMKSRFGWHDNTVVVGISASDIIEAKKRALQNATQKED